MLHAKPKELIPIVYLHLSSSWLEEEEASALQASELEWLLKGN